jgi:hypothetical protein
MLKKIKLDALTSRSAVTITAVDRMLRADVFSQTSLETALTLTLL